MSTSFYLNVSNFALLSLGLQFYGYSGIVYGRIKMSFGDNYGCFIQCILLKQAEIDFVMLANVFDSGS